MGCQGKIHSDGQREPYLQRPAGMKASGRFKKLHVAHLIWSPDAKWSRELQREGRAMIKEFTYHARIVASTPPALGEHSKLKNEMARSCVSERLFWYPWFAGKKDSLRGKK